MPVFRQFTADLSGAPVSTPRATPSAFGGDTAVALQGLGRQGREIGQQLVQVAEMRDKREAQVQLAKLRAAASAKIDEFQEKGEFATDQIGEFLASGLQEIQDGRQTMEALSLVQRQGANISAEINRVARNRDAKLAGELAQNDVNEYLIAEGDHLSEAPETLPLVLREADEFVQNFDIPPQAREAYAQELKGRMAQAAALGWIDLAPEIAADKIRDTSISDHLDAATTARLIGTAEQEVRAIETQRRQEERDRAIQQEKTRARIRNDVAARIWEDDPDNPVTIPEIQGLMRQTHDDGTPVIEVSDAIQMKALLEQRQTEGATRSDDDTLMGLYAEFQSGTLDQNQINEALSEGRLNQTDWRRFADMLETGNRRLRTARREMIDNAGQAMGLFPGTEQFDPAFKKALSEFHIIAMEREEEYRERDEPPSEYYLDGTAEQDLRNAYNSVGGDPFSMQDRVDMTQAAPNTCINGICYIGPEDGDRNEVGNWVPQEVHEAEQGEEDVEGVEPRAEQPGSEMGFIVGPKPSAFPVSRDTVLSIGSRAALGFSPEIVAGLRTVTEGTTEQLIEGESDWRQAQKRAREALGRQIKVSTQAARRAMRTKGLQALRDRGERDFRLIQQDAGKTIQLIDYVLRGGKVRNQPVEFTDDVARALHGFQAYLVAIKSGNAYAMADGVTEEQLDLAEKYLSGVVGGE